MPNKTEIVCIRFDADDRALLERAASLSKLSLTSYIRMVMLKDAEKRVDIYKVIREMKK